MAESRHRGCGDQCCCFPSSSQCYSRGRKMAAGGDDDGGATVFVVVVFLSSFLLFLFLLCFVWVFLSLLPRVCLFSSPLCFLFSFSSPFLQLASLFSPKNFSSLFLSFSLPKKSPGPLSSFSFPSIYKQEKREAPPALSHHGAGGKRVTLPLQGKVVGRLQGMVSLSFIYHVGRVCGSMGCCQFYASGM